MSKHVTLKKVSKRCLGSLLVFSLVVLSVVPMVAYGTTTTYRVLFDDAFISYTTAIGYGTGISSAANGGFSYPLDANGVNPLGGINRDTSPIVTGLRSMRIKFVGGYTDNVLGINFTSSSTNIGTTWDLSSMRNTGGFRFYVNMKSTTAPIIYNVSSFSIELASSYNDGGNIRLVENRIPISNYLTTDDLARLADADTTNDWTLVTIPFSAFSDTGTYYDTVTGAALSSFPFNWNAVKGFGFTCNTGSIVSGGINRTYDPHIDQLEMVTITPDQPDVPLQVQQFSFTNAAGSTVTSIADAGSTLKSKFNIVNNNSGSKHVALVIALYNGGVLERVQEIEQDVGTGTTTVPDAALSNPGLDLTGLDPGGTYSVKAFIWNSMDDMQPYDVVHPLN